MFPIISGERERTRPLGFAADFCEHCLSITRHLVYSRVMATHVYYFPVFQKEIDRFAVCHVCGSRSLRPVQFQRCILGAQGARVDIRQLLADTNPSLTNSTESMLDLWDQLETGSAREVYVARQFLGSQEAAIERGLAHKPLLAFAATALGACLAVFFWWGGNAVAAIGVTPLILLAPYMVIHWQHRRIARQVQARFARLLSGTATRRETVEQVLSSQAGRFPHTRHLWKSVRSRLAADGTVGRNGERVGRHDEYLALAHILPES